MNLLSLLPVIGKIIEKVIPDPAAAAAAKQAAFDAALKGELAYLDADVKLAVGQMEINREEAKDPSLFKSGWRPAVGWLCVAGFAYMAVIRPIVPWLVQVAGLDVPPLPAIDTAEIGALLFGMLGLGGMRSAERMKGKA
jgi:hypothetical protein